MQLDILTADRTLFSGEVESVTLPGSQGQFQVLNNHAALISSLEKGEVKIKSAGNEQIFDINGGVVEVLRNKVVVLA
jgi:F-type H+-transporting ATPase subunit epsilon